MATVKAFCTDDEAQEYISNLVTLELCKEFHNAGKPNTAIRACCNRLIQRATSPTNRAILGGLIKQPMPAGSLHQLRRVLHEMAGGEVVWAS